MPIRGRIAGSQVESDVVVDLLCAVVQRAHRDLRIVERRGSQATPAQQRLAVEAEQFLKQCKAAFAHYTRQPLETRQGEKVHMATMQWMGASKDVTFYRVEGATAYAKPMVETRRLIDNGARWQITRFIELPEPAIEAIAVLLLEPDAHIQVLLLLEAHPSVMGYVSVGSPELEDANRAIPIAARTSRVVEKAFGAKDR